MAKLIAREDYALKVGHGSCSSYSASRAVTRARAVSYGASISGSYSDNLLVAKDDLYKTYCDCNGDCRGYAKCPSYANCTCVSACANCSKTACSCESACANCSKTACRCESACANCSKTACTCESACAHCDKAACTGVSTCANCSKADCSCKSACAHCSKTAATCPSDTCPTYCGSKTTCSCNNNCASTCKSKYMCYSHCFSQDVCSCDITCDWIVDNGCGAFFMSDCRLVMKCGPECQCNGAYCNCDTQNNWGGQCNGHCTCNEVCFSNTYGLGCLPNCSSECDPNSCGNCVEKFNCTAHCDQYVACSSVNACANCSKSGCSCESACAHCSKTACKCESACANCNKAACTSVNTCAHCDKAACSSVNACAHCSKTACTGVSTCAHCSKAACSCYSQDCSHCTCNGENRYATCTCYWFS